MNEMDEIKIAKKMDFECTGADDHSSPKCPKCYRLRLRMTKLIREYGQERYLDGVKDGIDEANQVAPTDTKDK